VLDLAARYHHDDGRPHRLVVAPTHCPRSTREHEPERPAPPRVQRRGPRHPEQVWQAIATAKGMSAWFLPTEMEEREGGSLHFTMGPEMGSDGTSPLGPAAPPGLRGGLGRPHGQGPGDPEPAHVGVPRRGAVRRHLRRARHQQRLRDRRCLGGRVLGGHGHQLDAVLRQPAPLPGPLPRAGGHAMEATASHPASRRSCGRRCTTRSASAARARRSRCAAPPARSSAWASARRSSA
jgi:hypothetical protein